MSVGIIIITHEQIGHALLDVATKTLGFCPLDVEVLAVSQDAEPEAVIQQASGCIQGLDKGDGVLVLTDLYGSTPSNIACKLLGSQDIRVVTGINLPMLIKIFNYAKLELETLSEKAIEGGQSGVMSVQSQAN